MFTGIIEDLVSVSNIKKDGEFTIFDVKSKLVNEMNLGDSIALNGVCLTVVNLDNNVFTVNVVKETLSNTNLKDISLESQINLERALSLSSRLNGHFVQGHIESIGKIIDIESTDNQVDLIIDLDKVSLKHCIYKGSIAIDGISLTVAEINDSNIRLAIIPFTWEHTNLSSKVVGDYVNVETDMLSKYVEKIINY